MAFLDRMRTIEQRSARALRWDTHAGWWIFALLLTELAAITWKRWPLAMDLKHFVLYDGGSALHADELLAQGFRPAVDFAYSYGLLPLWLGRGWYAVLGRTPWAYHVWEVFGQVIIVAGMARLGAALRWRWAAILVLVVALPMGLLTSYLNQTHWIEAALLVWALAMQAGGKRRWALALVTAAAFVKPSMAYAYGAVLVAAIVWEWWRDPTRRRGDAVTWRVGALLREFAPAAVVGAGLLGLMTYAFGWLAVVRTLVPLRARKSYAAAHFGFFFGVGREFWVRPWKEYFTHDIEVLFWLPASALIIVAALGVLWGLGRRRQRGLDRRGETFLVIAFMHVVFVTCFYAWPNSWIYYSWLLVLGAATAVTLLPVWWRAMAAAALVIVAVAGQGRQYADWQNAWYWGRGPDTAGLSAFPEIRQDWNGLHELVQRYGAENVLLLINGYPQGVWREAFGNPVPQAPSSWFLSPALPLPVELERLRGQIAQVQVVVRYKELRDQHLDPWLWPEFADQTAKFTQETETEHFIIMVRIAPSAIGPSTTGR